LSGAAARGAAFLVLALSLMAVAGAARRASAEPGSTVRQAAWPSVQGGADHRGVASGEGLAPPLEALWRATLDGDGQLSPPVVSGGVALATAPGAVVGFEAGTGRVLWRVPRAAGPLIPPAVDPGGRVLVYAEGRAREDGALVALDLGTRRRMWRTPLGAVGAAGPTVAGGRVFVGTREGALVALDLATGRELWRVATPGVVDSAPAVSGDLVVVAAEDRETGRTAALAGAVGGCGRPTCPPVWTFEPRRLGFGVSSPAVVEGTVYVGLGDLSLYALDLRTGSERWRAPLHGYLSPLSSPAAGGGGIYVQDRLGGAYGLEAATGEQRWDFQFRATATWGSPLLVGGTVYVGLDDGTVAALRTSDGNLVWRTRVGAGPVGALAPVGEGHLLVPSVAPRGGLVALRHDPEGTLVDVLSPTRLRPGRALGNFALAAAALGVGLFALFRLVAARAGWGGPPAGGQAGGEGPRRAVVPPRPTSAPTPRSP
jgi:outer membrane protein assembly factor BamB